MSTLQRAIYVNPYEPAPLSLQIPSGIETRLALTFYARTGIPVSTDLSAAIELKPKSGGPAAYYEVAPIDVINGRARATFPADTLSDRNGYRLSLYGTVSGEQGLLAVGQLDLTPGSGFGVSANIPIEDPIDRIDITIPRGESFAMIVKVWQDADQIIPVDLTGATITSSVYQSKGGNALQPFAVFKLGGNEVRLELTEAQVATLPNSGWWTLVEVDVTGSRVWAEGEVTVL